MNTSKFEEENFIKIVLFLIVTTLVMALILIAINDTSSKFEQEVILAKEHGLPGRVSCKAGVLYYLGNHRSIAPVFTSESGNRPVTC